MIATLRTENCAWNRSLRDPASPDPKTWRTSTYTCWPPAS